LRHSILRKRGAHIAFEKAPRLQEKS